MAVRRIPGRAPGSSNRGSLIVAAMAAVLLVTLAVLQYRWTGELSAAANERMRVNLEESSRLLASDIDAPLAQLYTGFLRATTLTEPRRGRSEGTPEQFESFLSRVVQDWRENAEFPDILHETWVVLTDRRDGTREVFRFDEGAGRLLPDPGPGDMEELLRAWRRSGRQTPPLLTDRLIVPIPARTRGGRPGPPTGLIVARLNVTALEDEMLPAVIEHHFGAPTAGGEPEYLVSVTDLSSLPPRQIFPRPDEERANEAGATSGPADIEFSALRLRGFLGPPGSRGLPEPVVARRRLAPDERGGAGGALRSQDRLRGAWQVRIRHRSGSLEAATEAARRRNLYISSGVLTLIGIGFGLTLLAARRAQALAAQQVDFVAGVSHELNTPLQAIRSAGENLRAGVIREPSDVRGYGELIEREGRRLMRLIDQVLHYAGIGRGAAKAPAAQIDLGELLSTVVAESNWFLEEHRVELEVSGLDDLPAIQGDDDALNLAFANILHNAAKYGADDSGTVRVRVEAGFDADRPQVTVSITDCGPGIPAAEQQRIFEPFVRGRRAAESTVPGSGLGLSLARQTIEAHGGSITVDSEPGRTTFRVSLPASLP